MSPGENNKTRPHDINIILFANYPLQFRESPLPLLSLIYFNKSLLLLPLPVIQMAVKYIPDYGYSLSFSFFYPFFCVCVIFFLYNNLQFRFFAHHLFISLASASDTLSIGCQVILKCRLIESKVKRKIYDWMAVDAKRWFCNVGKWGGGKNIGSWNYCIIKGASFWLCLLPDVQLGDEYRVMGVFINDWDDWTREKVSFSVSEKRENNLWFIEYWFSLSLFLTYHNLGGSLLL